MIVTMICPSCGKLATAPRAAAGAKGKCANCGFLIEVPKNSKNCKVCGKDTAGLKRIKDPQGSYYCASCYEIAKTRALNATTPVVPPPALTDEPAAQPAVARSAAPPPIAVLTPADSGGDLLLSTALRMNDAAPSPSVATVPSADTLVRPAHCPNCGTVVVTTSLFCLKCGQDLSQQNVAEKLKEDDGTASAERMARLIASIIKWCAIAVAVIAVCFFTWLYISSQIHQGDKGLERTASGELTPNEKARINDQVKNWVRIGVADAFDAGHLVKVNNTWFRTASHIDPPELVERFSEYFRMKDNNIEVRIVDEANNHTIADRDKSGKIIIYPDKPDFP